MNFKNLYNNTSNEVKLQFLDALLMQNEELQKQFVKYAGTGGSPAQHLSFPEFREDVEDTRVLCLDFLGEIDTEIPGFLNEKQEIVSELYHHKPNLPALKGELKAAGLIN